MNTANKLVSQNPQFKFEPPSFLRVEGESGVRNLARLCRLLGYEDNQYFGQFDGACYGDLILFLVDNPGAVEAVVSFMEENFLDGKYDSRREKESSEEDPDEE